MTTDAGLLQALSLSHPWLATYPERVPWAVEFQPAPLYDLLDQSVKSFPDRICTRFLGRTTTYGDIGRQVDRVARGLKGLGVGRGSHVGLLLPNSPTFIVFYFATLKTGATVVNFNPLYAHDELAYQVRDSRTDVMVTLDLQLLFGKVEALLAAGVLPRAVVASFADLLPLAKSIAFRMLKRRELASPTRSPQAAKITLAGALGDPDDATPFSPEPIDPASDVAVIQYTGGTTGTPKGAMLTHANCHVNVQQVAAWSPGLADGEEKMMGVLPFFHVFAMTVVMNLAIARAAEIIIMPRFALDDCLALIDREKPTVMPGVPTLFAAIMNHPKLADFALSSLKFCISGGAPLPLEVKSRFEALTGCVVIEGYGLSETAPVATCNPLDGPARAGSIGLPLPGTRVSLRDLADPTREVAAGEKGEICIAGPQVMKGYWQKPEETARQFVGPFFRTGDVARMDGEGYLYIEDRIKDLIICSGYKVYPRRIEEVIYAHPAVEEVTVIGIRDPYKGEAPKAFVKLRAGAVSSPDDIQNFVADKLSRHEWPAAVEIRESLPKTMIGKLSKKELRAEENARSS